MQKSVAFQYTKTELPKKEKKKTFIITSKRIRYLGINSTEEVKTCTLKTTKHDERS